MLVYQLVAQFLKDKNYTETLACLEKEYGKPIIQDTPLDESLEDIINDRITFKELDDKLDDFQIDFVDEKVKKIISNQINAWTSPYPQRSESIPASIGLVITSTLINYNNRLLLFLGTSHMEFLVIDLNTTSIIFREIRLIGKVVIKKIMGLKENMFIVVGMNGMIYCYRFKISDNELTLSHIGEVQAHPRLITDVKTIEYNQETYVITLGWDYHLKVFKLTDSIIVNVAEIRLAIQGTCFDVTEYNGNMIIVLGKNENTLLDIYYLQGQKLILQYKISLNDAEFSSSGFTPRCLAIQKINNSVPLVAVGTSHEPYMRLIVVPLRDVSLDKSVDTTPIIRNQIIKNINTLSPQDKYSQSMVSWRPTCDKSVGIWVIGEDGILRGIDLKKGQKLIELVAHDGKIKTFASGIHNEHEMLVTFGIDKKIKLWNST